jgi:tetratricopeptide (TPR) repeat protein
MAWASTVAGCSPAPSTGAAAGARSPLLPSPDLTAGQSAFDLLHMTAARDAFAAAARAHPEAPLPHAYLALALNASGTASDAMATAVRLAAGAPPGVRARVEAARAWAAYDFDGAARALDAVLATEPGDTRAWLERGLLRLRQRRFDDAARDMARALQADPSLAAARTHLARALLGAGRVDEARAAAAEAVRDLPGEALSHLVQCEVLRRVDELPAAIGACGRAISLDPGNVTAWQGRAYVHRDREEFAAAREDFEAAFAVASALPDTAYKDLMVDWAKAEDISFDVAMTYLLENRWREAERAAEETAAFTQRTRPANAVFYYDALGRIYLQNGKPREAARAYQQGHESIGAVAGVPEDEQTLWRGRWVHGIGRAHARAGRFREAHAQADTLEKMIRDAGPKGEPYRHSLHYLRGYILLEERKYDRALAELRNATTSDVYIQWLMVRALEGGGQRAEAREIVERLRAQPAAGLGYALVRREILAWPRRPA